MYWIAAFVAIYKTPTMSRLAGVEACARLGRKLNAAAVPVSDQPVAE